MLIDERGRDKLKLKHWHKFKANIEEEYASFQKLLNHGKSEQEALQSLRQATKPKTGPENYQWLQHLWSENQWPTFADFLKWYNDLDVTPMI